MENKNCAPDQHIYDVIWNYDMKKNPNVVWKNCCNENCNHEMILPITTETLEEVKRQTKANEDLQKLLETEMLDPTITGKIWAFLTTYINFIGNEQKEILKNKLNNLIVSNYFDDNDKKFFNNLCTLLKERDTQKTIEELNNYYNNNYEVLQNMAMPAKGYQH